MDLAIAPAKVGDAMHAGVLKIDAGAFSIAAAAARQRHRVDGLPVVEEGVQVGMFTQRDRLVRALARGADPIAWRVADVVSISLCSISPRRSSDAARRQMKTTGVRRLVVLNGRQELLGLIGADAVGSDDVALRPARRVVFFRQVLDPGGRPYTFAPLAIRRFERLRGNVPWQRAADGYDVHHD